MFYRESWQNDNGMAVSFKPIIFLNIYFHNYLLFASWSLISKSFRTLRIYCFHALTGRFGSAW